jgi:anti-sigma B factor antagonist
MVCGRGGRWTEPRSVTAKLQMEVSTIRVAKENNIAYIQIQGKGSFRNAPPVKTFCQEMLREAITHFVVDLKECAYMDSTFLGTLAGLAMQLKQKAGTLYLINAGSHNLEIMKNLGLHRLPAIAMRPLSSKPTQLKELPDQPLEQRSTAEHMLEAHETLLQIDPANVAKFKDVVAYLKEDLSQSAETGTASDLCVD